MRPRVKERRFLEDRIGEELKDPEFRRAYDEADVAVRLAIRIAKLRQQRGLSQKALAKKIGTKQQVISRIESLDQANLTVGTLKKIARALQSRLVVELR